MTKWSDIVTRRATYRKGRNKGFLAASFIMGISGFIIGLTTHGEASTECVGVEECLAVHLESYEFAYRPEFDLPPRKPE